jgi:hypothetical protein
MIQRIQSLYLLGASLCSWISFKLPFFNGTKGTPAAPAKLTAVNFINLIPAAALALGALVLIFLFKQRIQQMKFTLIAAGVAVINLVLFYLQTKSFTTGFLSFGAIFPMAAPVLLGLAWWNMRKDEKLVKSLDRLR